MDNPEKTDENFELSYDKDNGVTVPVAITKMSLQEGDKILEKEHPDEVFEVIEIDYLKGINYVSEVSSKRRGVLDFYKQWKRGNITPEK